MCRILLSEVKTTMELFVVFFLHVVNSSQSPADEKTLSFTICNVLLTMVDQNKFHFSCVSAFDCNPGNEQKY